MTIHEIKTRTRKTSPFFFSDKTMRFFGQTIHSFTVSKQEDGRYKITAPSGENWETKHETMRFFNPINNELERK